MRFFLLIAFIFPSVGSICQSSNDYYVTNANDTMFCEIVQMSSKRVVVVKNGEKKKFKPNDIKFFTIKGDKDYKIVSLANDNNNFYREVINGKLSLYHVYTNHPYDRSAAVLPVMVKNGKIVYLNVVNPRKRIGHLIADCPDLYKEWIDGNKYSINDKEAIVNAYNDCMSKK